MNEIDLLQYNSEENTEQTPEKPKRRKTVLQMQALQKAQQIHKQNSDIRRQKQTIELENTIKKLKN